MIVDTNQKKHIQSSIEGLRGIAAVTVSLVHMQFAPSFFTENFLVKGAGWPVDLFFVISGFVICYAYGESILTFKNLTHFSYKRFLRLYPLHLITLVLLVFLEFARYFGEIFSPGTIMTPAFSTSNFSSFISNLFLVHVLTGQIHSFNGPSWSISAEFVTYLTFGAMILVFRAYSKLKLFFISSITSFLVIYFNEYINFPAHFLLLFKCIYGFSLGGVVFYLLQNYPSKKLNGALNVNISIILAIIMIYLDSNLINKNLLNIVFAWLIYSLVSSENQTFVSRLLANKFFQHIGKVSYSIYMWHVIVWMIITNILRFGFGNNGVILDGVRYMYWSTGTSIFITIVSLSALIFISTISFNLVEKRFRISTTFADRR